MRLTENESDLDRDKNYHLPVKPLVDYSLIPVLN